MTYRDDTAARSALADADARARRHLPMLDRVETAAPCDRKWDDMMRTADDRVRACGGCSKHVYDVKGMTAADIDRLILVTDATACVRYYQRSDGTLLVADCKVGARRRSRKWLAAAGVAAVLCSIAISVTVAHHRAKAEEARARADYLLMLRDERVAWQERMIEDAITAASERAERDGSQAPLENTRALLPDDVRDGLGAYQAASTARNSAGAPDSPASRSTAGSP